MANRDGFFDNMESQETALTFDDVRLQTGYSATDFHQSDLRTRFSRNVSLKIPVVSAAMDRVTEKEMAIALASLGGIGVIHRNLPIEEQARQVRRVKLYINGLITRPVCVSESETVGMVLRMCEDKNYSFRSFPVIDSQGRLVGVLTGNDIDFCNRAGSVREAMTNNVITGEPETTPGKAHDLMKEKRIKVLPLANSNLQVVGLYIWSDLERIRDGSGRYNTDKNGQLVVAAAVGTGQEAIERANELAAKKVDVIVVDSAHGDSKPVMVTLELIKRENPNVDVVVGNISNYHSAVRLIDAGADGIKVGQGGGSICTTRIVAGIGTPQVTAIHNCSKAVRDRKSDIPVCGDGGIRESGDITIAIGAGADSVMLGMMLAGTNESPGEVITHRNRPVKSYRGMGSLGAMQDSADSRNRYGERQTQKSSIVPEGVSGHVPYVGSLDTTIHRLMEGLRRGMGYVGVASIPELQQNARFYRITNAGIRESHPHDIEVVDN
jgi:IMP dehydrogenase